MRAGTSDFRQVQFSNRIFWLLTLKMNTSYSWRDFVLCNLVQWERALIINAELSEVLPYNYASLRILMKPLHKRVQTKACRIRMILVQPEENIWLRKNMNTVLIHECWACLSTRKMEAWPRNWNFGLFSIEIRGTNVVVPTMYCYYYCSSYLTESSRTNPK